MRILGTIKFTEADLKNLIVKHLDRTLSINVDPADIWIGLTRAGATTVEAAYTVKSDGIEVPE